MIAILKALTLKLLSVFDNTDKDVWRKCALCGNLSPVAVETDCVYCDARRHREHIAKNIALHDRLRRFK